MPTQRELLEKIERLSAQERAEVLDFIDVLVTKRAAEEGRRSSTRGHETGVSLEEVRKRLSTIEGSMADTVRSMREDRV